VSEFKDRLSEALLLVGVRRHGAGKWLADLTNITVKAANKWLNGESEPSRKNLKLIADATGVRPEWLQYGTGSSHHLGESKNDEFEELLSLSTPRTRVELLKIAQASVDGRLTDDDIALLTQIADRLTKKE